MHKIWKICEICMEIEGVRAEIRLAYEDLPDLNFIVNLELQCNKATFFETLSSNVKNITLGHQAWVFKSNNKSFIGGLHKNVKTKFQK